jgi:hypothetical protein
MRREMRHEFTIGEFLLNSVKHVNARHRVRDPTTPADTWRMHPF